MGSVGTNLDLTLKAPSPAVPDSFCVWAEPIYWSKDDTPDTVAQIKLKHNIPFKLKCLDKKP